MDLKRQAPSSGIPTLVDVVADLPAHAIPCAEIWYLTSHLDAGERRMGLQVLVTASPTGKLFTSLSLIDSGGHDRHAITPHPAGTARISTSSLDIDTGDVRLSGSIDRLELAVDFEGSRSQLTMTRDRPVIYSCGSGSFAYFGGPTHQFAVPGFDVDGSVELDGSRVDVSGRAWFDRQWSANRDAFGTKNRFTWFGVWLDDGRSMSVWDVTDGRGGGCAWATIVSPDGVHTVAPMVPLDEVTPVPASSVRMPYGSSLPNAWTLRIPGLDASLVVTHRPIHEERGFYSGLCAVSGTIDDVQVLGSAVVDTVPSREEVGRV
jgi:predicted secreted hydrolase